MKIIHTALLLICIYPASSSAYMEAAHKLINESVIDKNVVVLGDYIKSRLGYPGGIDAIA